MGLNLDMLWWGVANQLGDMRWISALLCSLLMYAIVSRGSKRL